MIELSIESTKKVTSIGKELLSVNLKELSAVGNETIEDLMELAILREFKAEDVLNYQGDYCSKFYFLICGNVSAYAIGKGLQLNLVKYFSDGDFVGSIASLIGKSYSEFTYEVTEPSYAFEFDFVEFKKLLQHSEFLNKAYIKFLERQLVLLTRYGKQ